MSTILLAALGSLGDLFPYLALACGLRNAGHTVIVATSLAYREHVEAAGCAFAALRPDPPSHMPEVYAKMLDPNGGIAFTIRDLIIANVRQTYEDLARAVDEHRCDLLINGFTVVAAPILAEKIGIPWISTVLAPLSFSSAYEPPALVGLPHVLVPGPAVLRPWWGKMLRWYAQRDTRSWIVPIDTLRAELELAAASEHPLFAGQHSPLGVLALFSRVLGGPQPDWPENVTQTGFLFSRAQIQTDISLQTFFGAGNPPIIFALGSTAVHAGANFYRISREVIERLRERAVFLIGDDERNRAVFHEPLPAHMFVQNYAPYQNVFPHASLVVHQGGVGTTAEALRAGVPQLIVPFNFDQADNALRVVNAHAGKTLPHAKYTVEAATHACRTLLADQVIISNAARISEEVRSENGIAAAVHAIENCIRNRADRATR